MKKIAILMALALASFSLAANRVGPVSQYGKLLAGKLSNGHGRIFGSCPAYSNTPVKVRGMSLYWSVHSNATEFYNDDAVSNMVRNMKIEVIRIPVATEENCWSEDCAGGYMNPGYFQGKPNKEHQQALVDKVVQSAVKNDIYVIIDWHSHTANNQTSEAKSFFSYMAQQYGDLDNVIFEVFNEPIAQDWGTIKNYADEIITEIRKYSSNLILVGSRSYDQYPDEAINNPINDKNVAYSFHYYANSHSPKGGTGEGDNAARAIKAGLPVFVSEWGTANADGGGAPNDYANNQWQQWLDDYDLSAANWSASRIEEGTAAFTTNSNRSTFSYTTSGTMVKNYLASNPNSYTACSGTTNSSSSTESSASQGYPVIDDFEDGNGIANTGLEDYWYAYTDVGNKGASTIGNVTDDDGNYVVVFSGAAAGTSKYGAGLTSISLKKGQNPNSPYVALGLDVKGGLAGCKTISYKYKGAAHSFKVVMEGDTDEDGDDESDLTGWNRHKADKIGSTSWTTASYVVPGDLGQESGWGINVDLDISKVVQLQWEVTSTTTASYFYIDDLECDGMNIVPVVIPDDESSSSVKPKSSSSSHVNPTCEDGETIDVGSTHMLCVDGEWTEVEVSSSSAVSTVVMIDDVEDGNTGVETLGEDGYWFLYTAGGSISNTQGADQVWDMVRGNSSNYYVAMEDISDITFGDKSYPSVGMSMNIPASALAGCSAIQYEYKGSGHMFRAAMSTVTAEKGYEHATTAKDKATSWTPVTVSVSDLKQPTWIPATEEKNFSWKLVYQLVWVVDEKIKDAQRGTYLDVDNVQCVGSLPDVEGSSSSGTVVPSSSSAEPECTEGQEIHVGSSDLKCVDGKWTDMNASSSSSSPNSSASTNPGIALIDDFQDENTQAESLGEAYWYIYESNGGSVTNKEDKKIGWDMVRTAGTNGYVAMEGISGITNGSTKYPSVGMGIDVPTSAFANCTAITYDYKGSAHKFRASLSTVTPDKGYEHVTEILPKASAWTPVTVKASDLSQPDWVDEDELKDFSWARVIKLAWVVDEKIENEDRGTELDIDNVQCVGTLPTPKSSSSTIANSSASTTYSSSSNGTDGDTDEGRDGKGNDREDDTSIGVVAASAGLNASIQGKTLVVSVARAGLVKVQVFDMMGHAIERHSENMVAGSFAHDFAKLNKGAYIVRVQQGSMVKTVRMQVR
ncbi:MAG: cellulase family glycosylhydrolase [Fibrobacter sp.]|nr:cellulase family glycosylhydrolase [Fibrobacter sp.]